MASTVTITVVAHNRSATGFHAVQIGVQRLVAQVQRHMRSAQASTASAARTLSRFGSAAGDVASHAVSALAPLAMFASKVALIGAAAVAVVPVVGNLIGIVQLIAPAAIAGAAALATLKLAFSGVGDALKAGLAGKTEEYNEALKKLSPSAADAVRKLVSLRDAYKSIQQATQEAFFGGMARDIEKVNTVIQPLAAKWLPSIANKFGEARAQFAEWFATSRAGAQLETILQNVDRFLFGILGTAKPLTQAFLDIAQVAAPTLGDIGENAREISERFAEWIEKLKGEGTLEIWLEKAKKTVSQIKDIGVEIGRVIAAIFSGGEEQAGSFLENVKTSISKLADYLESEGGQRMISGFMSIATAVAGIGTAIDQVRQALDALDGESQESAEIQKENAKQVEEARRRYGEEGERIERERQQRRRERTSEEEGLIGRIKGKLREWAEGLANVMGAHTSLGAAARGALDSISGAGSRAFSWVGGAIGHLGRLASAAWGMAQSINAALNSIRTVVNIAIRTIRTEETVRVARGLPSARGGGGAFRALQTGGVASGLFMAGERGRELIDFNARRVYNPAQTEALMSRSPGGTGRISIELRFAPGTSNTWFNYILRDLRAYIRESGGNVQAVLGTST